MKICIAKNIYYKHQGGGIMKKNIYKVILLLIIGISIICLVITSNKVTKTNNQITYNEFMQKVNDSKVNEVYLSDDEYIKFKLKDNDKLLKTDNPRKIDFKEILLKNNIKVIEATNVNSFSVIGLICMSIVGFLVFNKLYKYNFNSNKMGNNKEMFCELNISGKRKVRFCDIAGNIEAKESVKDLIDFIKDPSKYIRYGARIPRGVLFYGPPGTGKTLMAKAIASEAEVPFFQVCGSDFVQMYVGVGASRVRNLFNKARSYERAVVFIDEIDALAKKRSNSMSTGNEERDQTLNALLTEMSGFNDDDGIVVIAATNRFDMLDDAILRPGRFDRQIEIGYPDKNARKEILKLHARNKPIDEHVNLDEVASQTSYFSGAMLENLLNEAAINAAKCNNKRITDLDIDKAFYTVIAGFEKKDRSSIKSIDKEITAFHEAGHALITRLVCPENTISKVTIIPSTKGAGGFTMNIPPDRMYMTRIQLEHQMQIYLAGRVAEELIFGEENVTTGASNDIEKVTNMMLDYIKKYGMTKQFGLVNIDSMFGNSKFNSKINKEIMQECINRIENLYVKTKNLLIESKYYLNMIAQTLLVKESINEKELDLIMQGKNVINIEDNFVKLPIATEAEINKLAKT